MVLIILILLLPAFAIAFFVKISETNKLIRENEAIAKMGTNKTAYFILAILSLVFTFVLTCFAINESTREPYTIKPIDYFYPKTSGDFVYAGKDWIENNETYVIGLSDSGNKKDTIVFSEILEKYHIKGVGANTNGGISSGKIIIEKTNIYFPYYDYDNPMLSIKYKDGINAEYSNVFIASDNPKHYWDYRGCKKTYVYLPFKNYERYKNLSTHVRLANVEYYKNPTDEYPFFIDDVDGSKITTKAPTPYWGGYEFVDWYKDEQLTQKWDFENDIVPAKNYDSVGNYIYEPTKLFAKWKEI